jgi:hypothetical protein
MIFAESIIDSIFQVDAKTPDTSVGHLTLTLALSQRERGLIGGFSRSTPT